VTARFVASDAAEAEMFPTIGRSSSLHVVTHLRMRRPRIIT
jgi:hypothetical protein